MDEKKWVRIDEKEIYDHVFDKKKIPPERMEQILKYPEARELFKNYESLRALDLSEDIADDAEEKLTRRIPLYRPGAENEEKPAEPD